MNKFWVVGTSTNKYIDNFIKIIQQGYRIGDEFSFVKDDDAKAHIYIKQNKVFTFTSVITGRQCLDVLEALDIIRATNFGYIITQDECDSELLIQKSLLNLLKINHDNNPVDNYKFTKLISSLYLSKELTFTEIRLLGVKQKRGNLTKEKILKNMDIVEECAIKNIFFIKKAKEVLNVK